MINRILEFYESPLAKAAMGGFFINWVIVNCDLYLYSCNNHFHCFIHFFMS